MQPKPSYLMLVLASLMGTVLEWFDFAVYLFVAPVISRLFFPHDSVTVSLLMTYGVFALSYVARPIGGFVFGRLGDKFGRKHTLIATVLLMAVPALGIACLPTVAHIGVMATVLLLVFRLLQGIAAGGEGMGALTLLYESVPTSHQAMVTSLIYSGSGMGILLASAVVALCHHLFSPDAFLAYAWRLPFFLAFLTAVMVPFLRRRLRESPLFLQQQVGEPFPALRAWLRLHWHALLRIMFCFAPGAVAFYIGFVFMPGFLARTTALPAQHVMLINTLTTALLLVSTPVAGYIADRWDLKHVMKSALIVMLLFTPFAYALIAHVSLWSLCLGQMVLALSVGWLTGPLVALCMAWTQWRTRYVTMAVAYSLTYALFGGTAPLLGTWFIRVWPHALALSLYQMLLVALAWYGMFREPR